MTITLERIRGLSSADIDRLPGGDLVEARDLVVAALRTHNDEMSGIENIAAGRALTQTQDRNWHDHSKQALEMASLRNTLDQAIADKTIDRSTLVDLGPETGGIFGGTSFRAGQPLLPEQRMEDYARARGLISQDAEPLSLRKYLKGIITGEWIDADAERRAMTEGTSTAGGHLVPAPLSVEIIDKARNQTRVLQAGARTVPMESSTLKLARVVGDPTAAWHTELATIALSDMTLDSVTFTARALASRVQVSWELLEDAQDVEQVLIDAFAAQCALTLDLAALYGSGTAPEPRGVKNASGVILSYPAADAGNGGLLTYDDLVDAVFAVQGYNYSPTAIIDATRTEGKLAKLKASGSGDYLVPPKVLADLPRYSTVQVPTNLTRGTSSVASDVFVADWRQLAIGIRHRLEIVVLKERAADIGATELVAWMRADVQVLQPKAFDVVSGVL
jgi:HK97 family phage major capsid protein